jgi:CheY-like chemotaxis protein
LTSSLTAGIPDALPLSAPADSPPTVPDTRPPRVLLVDDDPSVSRVLGRMLEKLGCAVESCADGAEALARFRADPSAIDLVLTDETLPSLPGHELARALLELRPGLPVILCTGYSDRIDEDGARALGVSAFLMKPLDLGQLEAALRAALGRR